MVKTSTNSTILRTNYDTISIILRSLGIILLKASEIVFILKKQVDNKRQINTNFDIEIAHKSLQNRKLVSFDF